jgi:hypothetical protein
MNLRTECFFLLLILAASKLTNCTMIYSRKTKAALSQRGVSISVSAKQGIGHTKESVVLSGERGRGFADPPSALMVTPLCFVSGGELEPQNFK